MTRKAVLGGRSAELSKPNQRFPKKVFVRRVVCAVLAVAALTSTLNAVAATAAAKPANPAGVVPAHQPATDQFARIPLSFEPNQGQSRSDVQFLSRGSGYSLYLNPGGAVLTLKKRPAGESGSNPNGLSEPAETLHMDLLGANIHAPATGLDPQPGISNYFIGNNPTQWRTGIPTFGKISYAGIYPGVDLVFYGNQRQLEYDFVVKPGADPAAIAWFFRGARPRLGENGGLELVTPGGPLTFLAPVAYQIIDGSRQPVSARYSIAGQTVGFALGAYDPTKALIIDPVLSYFSYLGGTGNDYIGNSVNLGVGSPSPEPTQSIGLDSQRNLYVAGTTSSVDFPTASPVAAKKTKNPGQYWAFVSKFSPDGSKLLYSTYIGGSTGGNDGAWALAVDSTGNAYVTGEAETNDFPVTPGAFQTVCAPMWDNLTNAEAPGCNSGTQNAFVLKLNPTGSSLIYSSFLGGQGSSWGTGIAVDSAGQAYVTGVSGANGCGGPAYLYGAQYGCFPTTANALISDIGGGNPLDMAFMSVFNATGSALVYSTLFGDSQGAVSVKGAGCSVDCGAGTYGTAIALDPSGNVYIGGRTVAANMVTTKGAFNTLGSGPIPSSPQILNASSGYGYVAKFAPVTSSGTSLVYSTYFGGGAVDGGDVGGLAADAAGNAYIAGETHAHDFPASAGAYQTICDPGQAATFCNQTGYLAKLNPSGAALDWATFFGSDAAVLHFLGPVVLDSAGDVYVLGQGTGQLPLGGGTLSTLNGNDTVYAAKFDPTGSKVLFGATFGGPGNGAERPGGLAVDSTGNIYVGGALGAGGSFATPGAFQQAYAGGGTDAFVAKAASLQSSTTSLTLSAASVSLGQQVTLTAKVAGPQGSTAVPTGTVTFLSGSTTLGTGTLDKTGTATYSTTSLVPSTYTLTADYGGDTNYSASKSSAQTLVVNPVATTTTLTASAITATSGTSITFTATVSPASGSGVPTGTVQFSDGTTTLGSGTLDASGKAIYVASSLAVGSHSITAGYSGDTDDSASTSAALTITVTAAQPADFSLALSSTSGSISAGSPATLTVTLTPLNGFSAATSLACSGLPAHSTCAFSPSSLTPNGTAAATSTLTISSNVAGVAIAGGGTILSFFLLPILVGRNRRRRSLALLAPMVLLAALAVALSACSGSSGGGTSNNNTPKGTYTVTVTATSGSLSHSANYSYTVQ
ncbi:hypothetical protein DYQ86_24610 [Acidobacteria bacterium AB60]|nr:hypothetical protein DYQ86_24610 [Acidobacteria bacterium AB60]